VHQEHRHQHGKNLRSCKNTGHKPCNKASATYRFDKRYKKGADQGQRYTHTIKCLGTGSQSFATEKSKFWQTMGDENYTRGQT
jgi:hypothetical protein